MQKNGDHAKHSLASGCRLKVDTPAMYSIRFVGDLEENCSECLDGLKITSSNLGGKRTITTLSGPLPDQAALFSVLNALYDMRLPLISVVCLEYI